MKIEFEKRESFPHMPKKMFSILNVASVKHCTLKTIKNLYLPVNTRIINQLSLEFRRVSNSLLKIELPTALMKIHDKKLTRRSTSCAGAK